MDEPLRLVLLTGLSGAGKSRALEYMEDLGYYCVDNLPAPLLPTFVELLRRAEPGHGRAAVCVDSRSGEQLGSLPAFLDDSAGRGATFETVFLDCADDVLVQRYRESRRRHPAGGESVQDAVSRERDQLLAIRERADVTIDTSETTLPELRERLAELFGDGSNGAPMTVTVMSFGYKHGLPREADLIFDIRFLPNPYYVRELRDQTGLDDQVRAFVFESGEAEAFLHQLREALAFMLPKFAAQRRSYFTIGLGCTGGQHRSVALAEDVAELVRGLGFSARTRHRELLRLPRA